MFARAGLINVYSSLRTLFRIWLGSRAFNRLVFIIISYTSSSVTALSILISSRYNAFQISVRSALISIRKRRIARILVLVLLLKQNQFSSLFLLISGSYRIIRGRLAYLVTYYVKFQKELSTCVALEINLRNSFPLFLWISLFLLNIAYFIALKFSSVLQLLNFLQAFLASLTSSLHLRDHPSQVYLLSWVLRITLVASYITNIIFTIS